MPYKMPNTDYRFIQTVNLHKANAPASTGIYGSEKMDIQLRLPRGGIDMVVTEHTEEESIRAAVEEAVRYATERNLFSSPVGEIWTEDANDVKGYGWRNRGGDVQLIKVRGQNLSREKLQRAFNSFLQQVDL